jgi:predicted AAA+ superfamily ATPase
MIRGIALKEKRINKSRETDRKIYLTSFPFHPIVLNFIEKIWKSDIIR